MTGEQLYGWAGQPWKYVGVTKDGVVCFTADGVVLLGKRGRLAIEQASALGRELINAAAAGRALLERQRGEHLWRGVAKGDDGSWQVEHLGSTGTMRPVVNVARQRGREWKCTECRAACPKGATMYVCAGTGPFRWGHPRLCGACIIPDALSRIEMLVSFEVVP